MDLPPLFTPDPEAEAREAGLAEVLFAACEAQPGLRVYLLLDAAASADIPICLDGFNSGAMCLFDGTVGEELAEVAPWLVELRRHSALFSWYADEGHGNNWGIAIHTTLEPARLKARLKRFLKITDEDGETLFFKFYLPRNLNAILPEFEPDQRASFFNGIEAFWAEDRADRNVIWRHLAAPDRAADPVDLVATGKPHVPQIEDPKLAAQAILRKIGPAS